MTDFTIRSPFPVNRSSRQRVRRRLRLVPGGVGGGPETSPDLPADLPADIAAAETTRATLGATLVVLVVLLSLIGSVMILSASSVAAVELGGSSFAVFQRQLAWLAAGLAVLVVGSRIDYHRLSGAVPALVLGTLALLAAVLVPGLGVSANGAQRWLGFGSFQLQPAEPAKLALVVYVAALVARQRHRITDPRAVLRPALVVLGLFAGLLMLQPNLGTTVVLGVIVGCMLVFAGVPLRVMTVLAGAGTVLVSVFALTADYRRERITAFLHPWEDAGDTGYQTIQSLIGVASGGVSGTGLGESRAKWGFLPEAHTDFVFAIIGEELGLVGSLMVVGLFAGMVLCGLRIASRASDTFGSMTAMGISAWFAIQGFVNVGAVLGLLPITGVPLPFVSFGGSSLLTTMLAAGVLVNIAVQGTAPGPTSRGGRSAQQTVLARTRFRTR
jgi:cell division protein FtsW